MDRCDFSSILSSLRGYISEDHGLNQTDLLYELFASFMSDGDALDFDFDNGLVCRWFNGQAIDLLKYSEYFLPYRAGQAGRLPPSGAECGMPKKHLR